MDARLEQAILVITRGFREPLTLAGLAESVGLSPHHFHRLFLEQLGESPMAYVRRVRVKHAEHLLAAFPDASLMAIALDSGFSSAATFSRAYHHALGQTPSATRAEIIAQAKNANSPQAGDRPELVRFETRHFKVQRVDLEEERIHALLQAQDDAAGPLLGIFVDAPFHIERAKCRYFIAREDAPCPPSDPAALELQGGFYARVLVEGGIAAMGAAVIAHYHAVLVPCGYAIASTVFFERLLPGMGYPGGPREVFIQVRPAGEPVI